MSYSKLLLLVVIVAQLLFSFIVLFIYFLSLVPLSLSLLDFLSSLMLYVLSWWVWWVWLWLWVSMVVADGLPSLSLSHTHWWLWVLGLWSHYLGWLTYLWLLLDFKGRKVGWKFCVWGFKSGYECSKDTLFS